MYGWRARIGRISPSPETVGAEEWRRSLPEGVCLVESRVLVHNVTPKELSEMVKQVERAASEVASARVQVILQAGTAGAFFRGYGYDQELIRRIQAVTDLPATTTLTALLEALRRLAIRKLAVATPYLPEMDRQLEDVLERAGFQVLALESLGLQRSLDMGDQPPEVAANLARKVIQQAPRAEGILISCGNLRTFEIIKELEAETGLPVVTSNQAGLWQVLRMVGISDPLPGLGRLLREF